MKTKYVDLERIRGKTTLSVIGKKSTKWETREPRKPQTLKWLAQDNMYK